MKYAIKITRMKYTIKITLNVNMRGNMSLFSSLDSFVVTNIKLGDDLGWFQQKENVLFLYLQSKMKRSLYS